MEVKEKWVDDDFDEMGWHDSRLYQVKFPNEECDFILYLDYIFKWVEHKNYFNFWVSPSELIFKNVTSLNINVCFKQAVGVNIENIEREKLGLTPNKKMTYWKYTIITDKGNIELISTNFEMNIISQPILTKSQDMSN